MSFWNNACLYLRKKCLRHNMTAYLVEKFCQGKGIEIGPGWTPYCTERETIFIDRFDHRATQPQPLDILADAAQLPLLEATAQFILSSHCLEHCPNPLGVLYEWKRTLCDNGILFLILPHGERTFDRGRELTPLKHIIEDYKNDTDISDSTHWEEFSRFSIPQYKHTWLERARREDGSLNFEWIAGRGHLHYHVWNQINLADLVHHAGFDILYAMEELPERSDSFLVIARKGSV